MKGKGNFPMFSELNYKHDVVLFLTVPHLYRYCSYIQNNVHLELNTYGHGITHILAIYRPQSFGYYK